MNPGIDGTLEFPAQGCFSNNNCDLFESNDSIDSYYDSITNNKSFSIINKNEYSLKTITIQINKQIIYSGDNKLYKSSKIQLAKPNNHKKGYILFFEFPGINPDTEGEYYDMSGNVIEMKSLINEFNLLPDEDDIRNYYNTIKVWEDSNLNRDVYIYRDIVKLLLLKNGYSLILIPMITRDNYEFSICSTGGKNDLNNGCWKNDFVQKLVYDTIFKSNNPDMKEFFKDINKNEFGLFGVSVGSQWITRIINDFPNLYNLYPKCAVIIAGGNYDCYDETSVKRASVKGRCKTDGWSSCCPDDYQGNYGKTLKWENHPNILLIQSKMDGYADNYAAKKYYDILKSNNVNVNLMIANSQLHGITSSMQTNSIINFFNRYLI